MVIDPIIVIWISFAAWLAVEIWAGIRIEAAKWRRNAARSEYVHSREALYEVKRVAAVPRR